MKNPKSQILLSPKNNAEQKRLMHGGNHNFRWFTRYQHLVLIGFILSVYLDIPSYLFVLNDSLLPKYFYFLFIFLVLPIIVLKDKAIFRYLQQPFVWWLAVFMVINIVHLIAELTDINANNDISNAIITRIDYFGLFLAIGFVVSITPTVSYQFLFPYLAVCITLLLVYDFLLPGVIYPIGYGYSVQGRAAATFINANRAGEALLLCLFLSIPVVRSWYLFLLYMLVGIGIYVTFSRAALIIWFFLGFFLFYIRSIPRYAFIVSFILIGFVYMAPALYQDYVLARTDSSSEKNIQERMLFTQDANLSDSSSHERIMVLEEGLKVFFENPILGGGACMTSFWALRSGPHNTSVLLAAEYGIFGVALFLWLLVILLRGNYIMNKEYQIVGTLLILYLSIFTHNIVESLYFMLSFSILTLTPRSLIFSSGS